MWAGVLSLLFLLTFAFPLPLRSSEPVVHLRLCRMDVFPCQNELNLPAGGEVTLGLQLLVPEPLSSLESPNLVSWYVRASVEGQDAVRLFSSGAQGMPFQERGRPDLVLNDWTSVTVGGAAGSTGQGFFSIRNSYDSEQGILEYGVALLDMDGDPVNGAGSTLSIGEKNLLGLLSVEGESSGKARLSADVSGLAGSKIAVLDDGSDVRVMDLAVHTPLAVVNVGPNAEKARLEGHVQSDIPRHDGEIEPFKEPIQVEIWRRDAVPAWKGGADQPLVTYFNLEVDKEGSFSVSDLSPG